MNDPMASARPVDSAPRANGAKPRATAPKPESTGKLGKSLEKFYGQIGMMLFPFDQHCATAILENSESMAKAMEDLAKENAAVKRVVEKLVESSAYGTVFMAHAPVIMAIMGHHGPQVRNMFGRKPDTESDDSEEQKPETDMNDVPLSYSHPGDNAA